jgi:hypothetical protein
MKIAIGLFDGLQQAQAASEELQQVGVDREHLTVVVNNGEGEYDFYTGSQTAMHKEKDGTGAVVGTVPGHDRSLVGHDAITTPGGNSDVAMGPLWSIKGPSLDLLAGGLLGALVGAGVPDQTASYLMEGVRRGGTLIMAEVPDTLSETAATILDRNGAVELNTRVASWTQRGWDPYHTDTTPYTIDQMREERAHYDEDATVPVANHI